MDNHSQIKQRKITQKVRKADLSFLYATRCLVLFYISTKYHKNIPKGFHLQSGHEINGISLSNKTKGDNAKSKKDSVVILVRDTFSGPVLNFCQVPSKYSKGYLSYRAGTKSFSNKTKGDNSKSKKTRVVNLVCDRSSRPDLHFYQVSSKYSKGYLSYRADKTFYADADADANGIRPKNNMSPHPTPTPLVGGGGS